MVEGESQFSLRMETLQNIIQTGQYSTKYMAEAEALQIAV